MSTFLIIIICLALTAGFIVFIVISNKILTHRKVILKGFNRLKDKKELAEIISTDEKLLSLTSRFVIPKEIIQYRKRMKDIDAYSEGMREIGKKISSINSRNIRKESEILQEDIHEYLISDAIRKTLTVKQLNLLSEIRSASTSISSHLNSAEKSKLMSCYILTICLFEKVKHIDAFK